MNGLKLIRHVRFVDLNLVQYEETCNPIFTQKKYEP